LEKVKTLFDVSIHARAKRATAGWVSHRPEALVSIHARAKRATKGDVQLPV